MRILALVMVSVAIGACSDSGDGPPDPFGAAPAQGISISDIALFQTMKVPLVVDGAAAPHANVPILARKNAFVRVHVKPDGGWVTKPVMAKLKIVEANGGPERVLETRGTVAGPSNDADLATTLNFEVPSDLVLAHAKFAALLVDPAKPDGDHPATSAARYPSAQDHYADLDVTEGADRLRVKLIPIRYTGDGAAHLPDMSPPRVEAFRARLSGLYPAASVEMSVGDPVDYAVPYDPINWLMGVLDKVGEVRNAEAPPPDVYYYGAVDTGVPCVLGCVLGLSWRGTPVSAGDVYFPDTGLDVMAHELGHAHGLLHAPCGAADVDPQFPYKDGSTQVWGYDPALKALVPPTYMDMMGYCWPFWISDYNYRLIFDRVLADNKAASTVTKKTFRAVTVSPDGTAHAHGTMEWSEAYQGEEHRVRFLSRDGALLAEDLGFFYPYDHLAGGLLLVPEGHQGAASLAVTALAGREVVTMSLGDR